MYGKLMSVPDELMWKYYSYILCRPKMRLSRCVRRWRRVRCILGGKDALAQAVVERFVDQAAAELHQQIYAGLLRKHYRMSCLR